MELARRTAAENEALRAARDECERQFQTKVQEIGNLRADNERLRAALESIADLPPGYADMRQDDLVVILASKARAALNPSQEPRT